MRIKLSHPDAVQALVGALNTTECFAAPVGGDTVEVIVPWVEDIADARQAYLELLFFVRAWCARTPGVEATVVAPA